MNFEPEDLLSQITLPEGRPTSWITVFLLMFGALLATVFFVGFALPYLMFDAVVLERFAGRTFWIWTHVATATVALLIGPTLIWLGVKRRRLNLHRPLGFVYLAAVGLSSISAFYLAATTDVSWVFGMGLAGLGVAWIITSGMAFLAISRRMIVQHQEWMIRSYVTTFGFVTFRFLIGILTVVEVGTIVEQLTAASWFCWSGPLLITEAFIQGRKVLGRPVAAPSS